MMVLVDVMVMTVMVRVDMEVKVMVMRDSNVECMGEGDVYGNDGNGGC